MGMQDNIRDNIQDLYQELIIDHGTQPRNCCLLENATGTAEGFNPLCGDKVIVYLKMDKQTIQALSFTGKGCAISMASASLMTEALLGKTIPEALALSTTFKALLTDDNEGNKDNDKESQNTSAALGKLTALSGVKAFPARVKCATLAWHTLQAAILDQNQNQPITTETQF
jgi:nitrogen fixation NifU-like protein